MLEISAQNVNSKTTESERTFETAKLKANFILQAKHVQKLIVLASLLVLALVKTSSWISFVLLYMRCDLISY